MPRLTHLLLRHKLAVVAAWLVVLVAGGALRAPPQPRSRAPADDRAGPRGPRSGPGPDPARDRVPRRRPCRD